ncbi:MAG: SBBP repeat-containing protein [Aureispira sp.]
MRILTLISFFFIVVNLSAQDFLWATRAGGVQGDRSKSITLDINDNVYTVGTFRDTADFDPSTNIFNLITKGRNDIFIQKLDTDGNFIWAIGLGGTGTDDATAISSDKNGNLYITGSFRDTVDFDPSTTTVNLVANGNADIFVLKLDVNGNFLWVKQMGGIAFDEGNTITTDLQGNIYVAGRFNDSVDFDPNMGVVSFNAGNNSSSFIQKLDPSGNLVWAKSILGNSANEVFSIALDANNNVYTTGDFSGIIDFDPGVAIFNFTAIGGTDIFIQKLNAVGDFEWAKQMGGIGLDEAHSITIDPSGNIYSLGRFNNTVDFDPGMGSVSLTSNGSDDVYLQKLTANGDFIWVRGLGGSSFDDGRSITTDATGHVYLVGHFTGVVDFDLGAGVFNVTATGNYDAFIQKIDSNANLIWVKNIGAVGNDLGRGVITDQANNVYFTGYYRDSVDFDPGSDSLFLASAGDYDAFVEKLSACSVGRGVDAITTCNSYTWSNGITYTSSNNTATDTLIGASLNGCDSIVTLDLTLAIVDTTVTLNGNVLTANAVGASYQWIDCNTGGALTGGNNVSFTPSNSGDYAVVITTQNGCSIRSNCYNVTVIGVEQVATNNFQIYPNPTTGIVFISTPSTQELSITVLDVHGRVVLSKQWINQPTTTLELGQFPAGVYSISILTSTSQTITKLIKQ